MNRRKTGKGNSKFTPKEQIDLFLIRAKELYDSRAYQSGLKISFNLKWDGKAKSGEMRSVEPNFEDLRSFLVVFRKFVSEESPIFLNKIYNICHKHISDQTCKLYLAEARGIWQQIQEKSDSGMSVTTGGRKLTPKELAMIWINGDIFHDDKEASTLLGEMEQYQIKAGRIIALDYIVETTKLIMNLVTNIRASTQKKYFTF